MNNDNVIEMVEIKDNFFIPKNEIKKSLNSHGIFKINAEEWEKNFTIKPDTRHYNRVNYPVSGFKDHLLW